MTDEANRLVDALREDAEWAHANEWETPITLGDNLDAAANMIESLSAELEQTQNKLSELLYYVTGGRFSKTDYSTDDMRRFVDDYNQSTCDECDERTELEQVKRERDAAVRDMLPSCSICANSKAFNKYDNEVCADCYGKSNWQWRGVVTPMLGGEVQ